MAPPDSSTPARRDSLPDFNVHPDADLDTPTFPRPKGDLRSNAGVTVPEPLPSPSLPHLHPPYAAQVHNPGSASPSPYPGGATVHSRKTCAAEIISQRSHRDTVRTDVDDDGGQITGTEGSHQRDRIPWMTPRWGNTTNVEINLVGGGLHDGDQRQGQQFDVSRAWRWLRHRVAWVLLRILLVIVPFILVAIVVLIVAVLIKPFYGTTRVVPESPIQDQHMGWIDKLSPSAPVVGPRLPLKKLNDDPTSLARQLAGQSDDLLAFVNTIHAWDIDSLVFKKAKRNIPTRKEARDTATASHGMQMALQDFSRVHECLYDRLDTLRSALDEILDNSQDQSTKATIQQLDKLKGSWPEVERLRDQLWQAWLHVKGNGTALEGMTHFMCALNWRANYAMGRLTILRTIKDDVCPAVPSALLSPGDVDVETDEASEQRNHALNSFAAAAKAVDVICETIRELIGTAGGVTWSSQPVASVLELEYANIRADAGDLSRRLLVALEKHRTDCGFWCMYFWW